MARTLDRDAATRARALWYISSVPPFQLGRIPSRVGGKGKVCPVRNSEPIENSWNLTENQDSLATHPHQTSRLDWR